MAVDFALLEVQLLAELALVGSGSSTELRQRLGVSQPTFSRLVKRLGDRLLLVGRASRSRYAARRHAQDLADRLPIYDIGEAGRARRVATLHAILPEGYYVESTVDEVASGFHRDLPYFLHDLRPAGFLGRLVPSQHPELQAPKDVRLWSSNDVLRYVSRSGWNLPGSFIVGDGALQLYLNHAAVPTLPVERRDRKRRYPVLAIEILQAGVPGSCAAGEQPKFLASRAPAVDVLVKFSPAAADVASRRQADLLVAEHLAHRVLGDHGELACRSELITTEQQCFLEVERFDRAADGGRPGVLSLLALDAEFLGRMQTWEDSVARLARSGHVPVGVVDPARRRALFGRLIGNTDMHPGNLSFFARGTRVLELAPVYDMLPTLYVARHGTLVDPELELAPASPAEADVWQVASTWALAFWKAVAAESLISSRFRRIAEGNVERVQIFRKTAQRLPS